MLKLAGIEAIETYLALPWFATALILAHPEVFVDYEITKGRMDDVFLAATGKKAGEESL